MQAKSCGLPDNTPMVEVVEVEEDAGPAKTAMQIAVEKYRGTARKSAVAEYPLPKKRDEYLDFAVMPCMLVLHPHALCFERQCDP